MYGNDRSDRPNRGYGDRQGGYRSGGRSSGGFSSDSGPRFAPVKVGEELDVTIEAVGEKGDGIAKKNGFVLFVPGTQEGNQVRVKVTRVLRKVGFAEVVGQSQGGAEAPKKATSEEAGEDDIPQGEASEDFGDDSSDESSEDSEELSEEEETQ